MTARTLDIAALPDDAWTGLLTDRDLFLLPGWMRVGPGTYGGGLAGSCAALAERDGTLVAGTGAWLFGQDCTEDLCRPDVLLAVDPALGKPLFPTVLAGGWYDTRVAHQPSGADPADLLAVVEQIEGWGAARGAATVCWTSVDDRERDLTAILTSRGYQRHPLPLRWALEGPWTDLDDYLSRLPRKRRVSVKHELGLVLEAGITFRDVPLTAELAGPVVDLACENVARYGGTVDSGRYTDWVAALCDIPGGQAYAHCAERDGRIVGCAVTSTHAGRMYGLFPGFDYDAIADLPVYFALGYYHMVEFAAAHGIHAIEYGPTADQAKRGRGCTGYPQALWIKGLWQEATALLGELGPRPGTYTGLEGSGRDAG